MEKLTLELGKITTDAKVFENTRNPIDAKDPDIKSLAEDIRRRTLISPLVVWYYKGLYHLIAGFRRYAALTLLDKEARKGAKGKDAWATVPVLVYDGKDAKDATDALRQATLINIMENEARRNYSAYERAHACARLSKKPLSMTGNEIAKELGAAHSEDGSWSKTYVNRLIALTVNLSPEMLTIWQAGKEGASIGNMEKVAKQKKSEQLDFFRYQILRLPDPRKVKEDEEAQESTKGIEPPVIAKKSRKRAEILDLIAACEKNPEGTAGIGDGDICKAIQIVLKWAASDREKVPGVWPVAPVKEEKEDE